MVVGQVGATEINLKKIELSKVPERTLHFTIGQKQIRLLFRRVLFSRVLLIKNLLRDMSKNSTSKFNQHFFYPNTAHLSSRPRRTFQKNLRNEHECNSQSMSKIFAVLPSLNLLSRQFNSFSFQWLPPPSPHSKFITNETSFCHSPDTEAL